MEKIKLTHTPYQRAVFGFKEWLSVLGYADSTTYSLPNHITELLHYLESKHQLNIKTITKNEVEAFYYILKSRKNKRTNTALSNAYLNKYIQALRLFSRYLRETGQGGFTVTLENEKQSKIKKEILTQTEIKALFEATPNNTYGLRDKAMLSLFYGCGLRRNEGVRLDVSDILIDRQLVYIRKGKNYTERYVPTSNAMMKHLVEYMNHCRNTFVKDNSEALLLSQRGERIGGQSLSLRLNALSKEVPTLATKKVTLHGLRHSIATHLLMEGMKLERIAQFLGHKSMESTQVYTHLVNEIKYENN